jgi:putative oxidoreductase
MSALYDFFVRLGEKFSHWFLLAIRLFWGIQFALGGWAKLQNLKATTEFFGKVGIPYPDFHANLVGYVELIGGLALAVGLLSRIASIPLIITMIVALFTAHVAFLAAPMSVVNEPPFNFLLASLTVFSFGPGRFSLDNLFLKNK